MRRTVPQPGVSSIKPGALSNYIQRKPNDAFTLSEETISLQCSKVNINLQNKVHLDYYANTVSLMMFLYMIHHFKVIFLLKAVSGV